MSDILSSFIGNEASVGTGLAPVRNARTGASPVPTGGFGEAVLERPTNMQARPFAQSQYPGLITYSIIIINVIVYLIVGIYGGNLMDTTQAVFLTGGQNSLLIRATGEYWRIFTAMFLHFNLIHIGLNMLSLFIIGREVEIVYGKWRYLIIYLASGIAGGIVTYFYYYTNASIVSAGASGAIFGVFGALGVFYLQNRGSGAYGQGAIGNWLLWLGINLIWGIAVPGIGIVDHIGGLVAGMVLAFFLLPRARGRRI